MKPGTEYLFERGAAARKVTVLETPPELRRRARVRIRYEQGILTGEVHDVPSRNITRPWTLPVSRAPSRPARAMSTPAAPVAAGAAATPRPEPTLTIKAPHDGHNDWGEWVQLNSTQPGREVALDLEDLYVVGPLLLCRLRGFIDAQCAAGGGVQVTSPRSPSVRRYFNAMGLTHNLPQSCLWDLGGTSADGPRSVLLPIRRLRSPQEVAVLDHELESVLTASFTGKIGRLASAFTMTVSEMCDNATTHGESNVGFAYVAAQRIHPDRCVLAIGDLGLGIPNHIRRVYPELVRDEDAIREATREGASGTGDPERGFGYQWVIDSMKEAVVPDGDLRAWSGRGRFRVHVREGIQIRRRAWAVDQATPGTWVVLSLRGGRARRRTTVDRRGRS